MSHSGIKGGFGRDFEPFGKVKKIKGQMISQNRDSKTLKAFFKQMAFKLTVRNRIA